MCNILYKTTGLTATYIVVYPRVDAHSVSAPLACKIKPCFSFLFRTLLHLYASTQKVHGKLFRAGDLDALTAVLGREDTLREKEERRIALKRQQFEDSMVRNAVGRHDAAKISARPAAAHELQNVVTYLVTYASWQSLSFCWAVYQSGAASCRCTVILLILIEAFSLSCDVLLYRYRERGAFHVFWSSKVLHYFTGNLNRKDIVDATCV